MTRLAALLVALVVALGPLAGCAQLPTSGPVRHEDLTPAEEAVGAPYFDPPGPATDASPDTVVAGFLTALQANPLSTKVAREFLSERVRASWQPNRGTLVYEAFSLLPASGGVRVRLADVRRLDDRGGWRGGQPGRAQVLDLTLVAEDGQWRIDNPPSALIVPASFFERTFERTNLYFPDQAGRLLLPEPVFVPRGEQTATKLVRGLLAGPGPTLAAVARTAFPRGSDLELSVVVTEGGTAEVPLTREALRGSPRELRRAADQLAWTLGQVPGVQRVRMSVGGTPVPLPGGLTDLSTARSPSLDAAGPPDAPLLAVRDDRLVRLRGGTDQDVAGRLGDGGFSPRSLAVGDDPTAMAGVTDGGTRLLRSPLVLGPDDPGPQEVLTGTDLARPSYDLYGGLWVLDRAAAGARLLLVEGDALRQVEVEGLTGRDVTSLAVAPDGSRLVAVVAGGGRDRVVVVPVRRSEEGAVAGLGTPLEIGRTAPDAPATDVGWRDPVTVAVLSRPTDGGSRVDFLSVDGSPLGASALDSAVLREAASELVVSPSEGTPLGLLTPDGDLYELDPQGTWLRSWSRLGTAAFG